MASVIHVAFAIMRTSRELGNGRATILTSERENLLAVLQQVLAEPKRFFELKNAMEAAEVLCMVEGKVLGRYHFGRREIERIATFGLDDLSTSELLTIAVDLEFLRGLLTRLWDHRRYRAGTCDWFFELIRSRHHLPDPATARRWVREHAAVYFQ